MGIDCKPDASTVSDLPFTGYFIGKAMKARLLVTIQDGDTVLAAKGEIFEWNDNSTHQLICGYLLHVDEFEVEFEVEFID